MKLKLLVELDYDEDLLYGENVNERNWFHEQVLHGPHLSLFDQDIGDTIGTVKVLTVDPDETRATLLELVEDLDNLCAVWGGPYVEAPHTYEGGAADAYDQAADMARERAEKRAGDDGGCPDCGCRRMEDRAAKLWCRNQWHDQVVDGDVCPDCGCRNCEWIRGRK